MNEMGRILHRVEKVFSSYVTTPGLKLPHGSCTQALAAASPCFPICE